MVEARGRRSPGRRLRGPATTALGRLFAGVPARARTAVAGFRGGWAWYAAAGDGTGFVQIVLPSAEPLPARAALPAGSYLLAGQLGPPRRDGSGNAPARARFGGTPVQIAVTGADALLVADTTPAGSRVDVVVTTEPTGLGPGRTYVAAAGVRLIALGPGPEGPGPTGSATATLALSRKQALRLISAENFARQVRLLPRVQARGVRSATQGG